LNVKRPLAKATSLSVIRIVFGLLALKELIPHLINKKQTTKTNNPMAALCSLAELKNDFWLGFKDF
jgi:hypothetical protein